MSEPSATLSSRMRVLVVDDEPLVRRLSRRMLEHAGYEVHEAADAPEAIAVLAESGGFDVVVSDLQMPMDGEALRHLASQPQSLRVGVGVPAPRPRAPNVSRRATPRGRQARGDLREPSRLLD